LSAEFDKKLIPVRVKGLSDLARIAANIIALGQPAYIIRFKSSKKGVVYGLIAVLRDYYNLYGLPMLYYFIDEEGKQDDKHYLLVKVDDSGEHVELSRSTRPGWVPVPIIDLEEKPKFMPEEL